MKTMTHQEMLELTILILENVKNGNISEAKKQIEKLTPIQVMKLFGMGHPYHEELATLKTLAIYHWD